MSGFPKPTNAPAPKTRDSAIVAKVYAAILVVMVLLQLFSFPDFVNLFYGFSLPGGHVFAVALAGIVATAEVFAIPFLLGMRLSPAFRAFSMFLGWLAPAIWLFILTSLIVANEAVANSAILGSKLIVPPSWGLLFLTLALGLLAAWASWGLWPLKHARSSVPARKK
jgi:hypothetical protein